MKMIIIDTDDIMKTRCTQSTIINMFDYDDILPQAQLKSPKGSCLAQKTVLNGVILVKEHGIKVTYKRGCDKLILPVYTLGLSSVPGKLNVKQFQRLYFE